MNRVNGGIIEGIENQEIIVKSTWVGISDISFSEENGVIITPPEDKIFEKPSHVSERSHHATDEVSDPTKLGPT